MKLGWMVVCEQTLVMSDGRPSAMGLLLGELPWAPPCITMPITVLFVAHADPHEIEQKKLTATVVNPDGHKVFSREVAVPGNLSGRLNRILGIVGGQLTIAAPGDYELQLLLDGQPLDDAPTWSLKFRDVSKKVQTA